MKVICTTSPGYEHLMKMFIFLFNKNWSADQHVEIVGYGELSYELPSNFSFYSMGTHSGNKKDFSNDLRKYFAQQDQFIIWCFDDSFVKEVNFQRLEYLEELTTRFKNVGRINLSNECTKQDHICTQILGYGEHVLENTQTAKYRLSTQPSIWNKDFLLQYLKPDLSPWDFESQHPVNDGWRIFGFKDAVVHHNEGVRRFDLYKYDLNGIKVEQIEEMKKMGIL